MLLDIKTLQDNLDEEVDVFGILNSLDDDTIEELRYITKAFSKFYAAKSKNKSLHEIIYLFDTTLESITMGVMGTSFKTKASNYYKELPTIKEGLIEENKEIEAELKDLRKQAAKIPDYKKEISNLKARIKSLEDQIDYLERSSRSSSSYGSCGGSYGRC